jgi:hypothetical protein
MSTQGFVTAGIVSALHRTAADASVDGTSSGSVGVRFAIPSSQARQGAGRLLAQA